MSENKIREQWLDRSLGLQLLNIRKKQFELEVGKECPDPKKLQKYREDYLRALTNWEASRKNCKNFFLVETTNS